MGQDWALLGAVHQARGEFHPVRTMREWADRWRRMKKVGISDGQLHKP